MARLNNKKHQLKVIIIFIIIVGFITTFISGYYLASVLIEGQNWIKTKTSPDSSSTIPKFPQDPQKILPGKFYFQDTLLAITKDKPHITLVASVARLQKDNGFSQDTIISYFDRTAWTRLYDHKITPSSVIESDKLIKKWNIIIDPARVLKQAGEGQIQVNGTVINFSTAELKNEIGIRSLPGNTRFLSKGNGVLRIGSREYPAYILYNRVYSINVDTIQFYDKPHGITTDSIAFWDSEGNFYLADSTTVDKPTPIYQTHGVSVMEDTSGSVTKTFDYTISRDSQTSPSQYTVEMKSPIEKRLRLKRVNFINKQNSTQSLDWFIGNIEGTVEDNTGKILNGVGFMEYIHD